MLGWRPLLLSGLALLLLTAVVLDVSAAGTKSGSCASAKTLTDGRYFAQARQAYATVLKQHPMSACATAGLRQTSSDQCVLAQRIAVTDPAEAHTQLLAIVEQDPSPEPRSCVWEELHATAAAPSTK